MGALRCDCAILAPMMKRADSATKAGAIGGAAASTGTKTGSVGGTAGAVDAKEAVRRAAKAARAALSPEERSRKSQAICDDLARACDEAMRRSDFASPMTVALYSALRDEVSLDAFARHAYRIGLRVCFPAMVCRSPAEPMAFFAVPHEAYEAAAAPFLAHPVRAFDAAELEAEGFLEIAPEAIDVMAVPLVAFDGDGGRLGYGGGNYDRYLPRLRDDAVVLGVAFEEQRVCHVPRERHDAVLSAVMSA